jgi:hypothetical protein
VPFLRFSRDRRGYENTFLLHAARPRGEKDRPRLLYWFRTPPHLKVGRTPFDEDAIRLLEDEHPEVDFDWSRLLEAPPTAPADWNGQAEDTPDNPLRSSDSTAAAGGDAAASFRSSGRRRRRGGGRGSGA